MRRRPLPLLLCALVIAVASLAGLRGSARATAPARPATGGFRYGLSSVGLSHPFAATIAKGFADAAARAGATAVVLDARGSVQKQANDIDDLLAQRVKGTAIMPLDSVVAQTWVARAGRAGTPVAAVAALIGDPRTRAVQDVYPGPVAFASQDEVAAGEAAGRLAARLLPRGRTAQVAVIEGAAGFPEVEQRAGTIARNGTAVRWASPGDAKAGGVTTMFQHVPLVPTLSAFENIVLDEGGWRRGGDRARVARIVASLGAPFALDAPVADLPIGTRQMVAIAQALASAADVIVMDEPAASLAGHERLAVYDMIRALARDGKPVLFVLHCLDEIVALTDDVTVLRDGRAVLHAPTAALDTGAIAAAIAGRPVAALTRAPGRRPLGDTILSVRDLASPAGLALVSFDLRRGEILVVAGVLGSGRSELLHTIFGADPAALTLADNIALPCARGLLADRAAERARAEAAIARLAIRAPGPEAPPTELSGGNARKVVIAKWLSPDTRALLLDEPTAGIDIGARTDILTLLRALADDGLPIVLASSEFGELLAVADRILVLRDSRLVDEADPRTASEADLILMAGGERPVEKAA